MRVSCLCTGFHCVSAFDTGVDSCSNCVSHSSFFSQCHSSSPDLRPLVFCWRIVYLTDSLVRRRFFGREKVMVNESNPFFYRVLLYIFSYGFPWWALGWYWAWKKSGAVSGPSLGGLGFVVGPCLMLEPASLKMTAMVAISWPRLVSCVVNSLAMLKNSSSFMCCFQYSCKLTMMVLFNVPPGCADPPGMRRCIFIGFWYVRKLKLPLVGSRAMLRLRNTVLEVSLLTVKHIRLSVFKSL
jgi:hypothetical protein